MFIFLCCDSLSLSKHQETLLFHLVDSRCVTARCLFLHPFSSSLPSLSLSLSPEVWLPAQPGSLFSRPEAPCVSVPEGQHWQAAPTTQEGASRSAFWTGMTHGHTYLGAFPISFQARDESVNTWTHGNAYICANPHHRCPVNCTHFVHSNVTHVKASSVVLIAIILIFHSQKLLHFSGEVQCCLCLM